MLERLKKALVSSFVGAIGLGWVFAQGILHFAYAFSAPVASSLARSEYRSLTDRVSVASGFLLRDALPELMRSFVLLLVGYFLLRWLYFTPSEQQVKEPDSVQSR